MLDKNQLNVNDLHEISGGAGGACFVYNTRPGDTLKKIATRFATNTNTLMELNKVLANLKPEDAILSGTKLLVPFG